MINQVCNLCFIEKEIKHFEWQKNRPNPRKTCINCRQKNRIYTDSQKIRIKEYKEQYRKSGKAQQVIEKHLYGISKNQINYASCIICNSTKRLVIDHCHKTDKFRGLLCSNCNTGLGMFKDNIDFMLNAIKYLNHFEKGGNSLINKDDFQL